MAPIKFVAKTVCHISEMSKYQQLIAKSDC